MRANYQNSVRQFQLHPMHEDLSSGIMFTESIFNERIPVRISHAALDFYIISLNILRRNLQSAFKSIKNWPTHGKYRSSHRSKSKSGSPSPMRKARKAKQSANQDAQFLNCSRKLLFEHCLDQLKSYSQLTKQTSNDKNSDRNSGKNTIDQRIQYMEKIISKLNEDLIFNRSIQYEIPQNPDVMQRIQFFESQAEEKKSFAEEYKREEQRREEQRREEYKREQYKREEYKREEYKREEQRREEQRRVKFQQMQNPHNNINITHQCADTIINNYYDRNEAGFLHPSFQNYSNENARRERSPIKREMRVHIDFYNEPPKAVLNPYLTKKVNICYQSPQPCKPAQNRQYSPNVYMKGPLTEVKNREQFWTSPQYPPPSSPLSYQNQNYQNQNYMNGYQIPCHQETRKGKIRVTSKIPYIKKNQELQVNCL